MKVTTKQLRDISDRLHWATNDVHSCVNSREAAGALEATARSNPQAAVPGEKAAKRAEEKAAKATAAAEAAAAPAPAEEPVAEAAGEAAAE